MKSILLNKLSVSLYCDVDFIKKMSNIKSEPIIGEKFFNQTGACFYINMHYLNDDNFDKIHKNKDEIFFYWSDDLLSIFELNYSTFLEKGVLQTNELNFLTNEKNEDIYVYIFLNT